MRLLPLLGVVLAACVIAPPVTSLRAPPTLPGEPPTSTRPGTTSCAPALQSVTATTVTLTLLPHEVGHQYVFGLDGSLVATAYAYPIGAQLRWWEVAANGDRIKEFEWPLRSSVVQSPEGRWVVYLSDDTATGETAVFVRDLVQGTRFLRARGVLPFAWPDADHALFESDVEPGVIHRVDLRSFVDEVVFRPPPPPSMPAAGDEDWFSLTSDVRWAIFTRARADGEMTRTELFDVARQTYVVDALPPFRSWIAPRGDLLVWFEGSQLRAMHLCDRRAITLMNIPASGDPLAGTVRWSADARFLSFSFGLTDEDHGPQRAIVVDLQRGTYADIAQPWGYVQRWSPDGMYVVLSRLGYHATTNRLARLAIP